MITRDFAEQAIAAYLRASERSMDQFGSALPQNRNRPPHRLVVTHVDEYDFGWVYFYNSQEFVETGDFLLALGGNAPVIVRRDDGCLYITGTAMPTDHYIEEFRAGKRRPINEEQV